ncbi:hypothetical protein C9374_007821 [Naegleria lovaniensis]|uniref:Uncharacterized protein n=1 Tax=Naegleria lovaniensis TaxID=51637 RepID=A0AA88KIA2_NAELO|nr:uncharacterized protein C9374_007821 [Naegleria lovaniensis]KAG2378673.1 hypothetical protein C9374_007821 [Naegleria lovaniensis]
MFKRGLLLTLSPMAFKSVSSRTSSVMTLVKNKHHHCVNFNLQNYHTDRAFVRNDYNNMRINSQEDEELNRLTQLGRIHEHNFEGMEDRTAKLAEDLLNGSRVALSKSITLVESKLLEHHKQARHLLAYLAKLKPMSEVKPSFRIGLSGPPGAGKSTMIEDRHENLAVLAVDPSSTRTGGSILGDKTRMIELSRMEEAFIRPSPSLGFLGGVTANMYEIISLCEYAGYDNILVETVGVGQSETLVADLTDMVILVVPPAGGDELQGMKRGIVEVADLVVVNKADGDLIYVARRARGEYRSALHYMRPKYPGVYYPEVVLCSSRRENPMEETKFPVSNVWEKALAFRKVMNEHGLIEKKRQEQRKTWMWKQVNEELVTRLLHGDETTSKFITGIQNYVEQGEMSPRLAADCILQKFLKTHK